MPADPMLSELAVARWTAAAAAWLLTYLVHSTLVMLGVWALASSRRVTDATREILWKAALVGGVITATAQSAVTREPLGGQLRLGPRPERLHARAIHVGARVDARGDAPLVVLTRSTGMNWTAGLVVLWLTGAGVGLLLLTAGYARTSRLLGERVPLDGTPVARRLEALLARAGVSRRIALTCSRSIASPVALPGDEVCLPRRAMLELEPTEQDSMLAHEVAHLVRRDPHWLAVARVIEVILFVQPLNRLARHRLQEAAEFLSDDWAVRHTSEPVTLARCLAAVAEWVARAPRLHLISGMIGAPPVAEAGGSPLVRRVGRILGDGVDREARSPRAALRVSACALLALAVVAPRVSVMGARETDRTVAFVRMTVRRDGAVVERDSLVMLQSRGVRVTTDSVVRSVVVLRGRGAR